MNLVKRNVLFCSLAVLFIVLGGFTTHSTPPSKKIQLTTNPITATIKVNGAPVGTGSYKLTVVRGDTYTVEVSDGGFITQSRVYTYAFSGRNDFFNLAPDPAFNSTTASEYVNRSISLEVKDEKEHDDAWKVLTRTVFSYFDIIESNDKSSGYLRTSWVGTTWPSSTTRIRVIIKKEADDPISFSLKFISEIGPPGVQFSDDAKFSPYGRIPKRYDGFVEELMTKLKN